MSRAGYRPVSDTKRTSRRNPQTIDRTQAAPYAHPIPWSGTQFQNSDASDTRAGGTVLKRSLRLAAVTTALVVAAAGCSSKEDRNGNNGGQASWNAGTNEIQIGLVAPM